MIFGWDVSTSIIGVAVLDDFGKYVASEHLDLRKVEGFFNKGDRAEPFVRTVIGKYGIHGPNTHHIEERLGGFSLGKTMLQTLMVLASFNALVSWFIRCMDPKISHIHPSTVKSIMRKEGLLIPKGGDKKKLTLDFVSKNVPGWKVDLNRNDNPQPWNFDRADAYIVAKAGFLKDAGKAENSDDCFVIGLAGDAKGEKDRRAEAGLGTGADPQG